MSRFRTAAVVAMPLLRPLLAAGPASAAEPAPLSLGSVRSVHPGDTLAVTAASEHTVDGDTINSPVLLKAGRMRMTAPRLTAAVIIACDARPGTYPVTQTSAGASRPAEHGPRGHTYALNRPTRPRVAPAATRSRRCPRPTGRNTGRRTPPGPSRNRHAPDQGENHPNQPWARLRIAPASRPTTCPTQQAAHRARADGACGPFGQHRPGIMELPIGDAEAGAGAFG